MVKSEYSSGLISLIPMFYVGWSDSVLSPSEMSFIHKKISDLTFLSEEDKSQLILWTNPLKPPGDEVFKSWVNLIKRHANDLGDSSKESMVSLGIEMAKTIHSDEGNLWKDRKVIHALSDIEEALGIKNSESYNLILNKIRTGNHLHNEDKKTVSKKIQVLLDGTLFEERNKVKSLLQDPAFKIQHFETKEQHREQCLKWLKLLAIQGYGSLGFPKEYGGQDNLIKYGAVFEVMAQHDISLLIKFGVQFGLFGSSIHLLGTERHHKKYLESLSKAELLGCFAMTETGHGSNVRGLETTATFDKNSHEIIIHTPHHFAGKEYIGNALDSKMSVVFAQLIVDGENHGVHAVVVPLRNENHELLPGVTIKDNGYKMGLNGVDNGRIWFDQVRVPSENLLDKYGSIDAEGIYQSSISNPSKRFFTILAALVGGRIFIGVAGNSISKKALTIAIKYGLKRRQFNNAPDKDETLLLDYPSHQARLMPRLAKSYAIHFGLSYLRDQFVTESMDRRKIETLAAGMKAYSTWHCTKTVQECREACGGKGYLAENQFTYLKADSDIFTTFEGDNTVLMQLVAKGLLSEFKQEFHDEGYRAVIRILVGKIGDSITEINPTFTRKTDASHLLDKDFQYQSFKYRERKMLVSVGERMQRLLKRRVNAYDAFLRTQTHMIATAEAYIERVILKSFIVVLDGMEDGEAKTLLTKVKDLYALSTIQENKGWYLECDYMHGSKTKAIRRVVSNLCKELRAEASILVDAFDIPDELLAAEIVVEKK